MAVLAALAAAPAQAQDVRLEGLDAIDTLFRAGGSLLAGDRVVVAGTDALYAWPTAGGTYEKLADLPDLGPATNSITDGGGYVRVVAASPERVLVGRGEGGALGGEPYGERGHFLRVGPPTGPFADPAGCREHAGMPADLDGDLVAYAADAADAPACADGETPAVDGPAIVVRDLGSGDVVARVRLPRPDAVGELALRGRHLAYTEAAEPLTGYEDVPAALVVVDLRTGAEILRLRASTRRRWVLGDDGTIVSGLLTRRPLCHRLEHVVVIRAGTRPRELDTAVCGFGHMDLRGDRLRVQRPGARGTTLFAERDLGTGAERLLSITHGWILDADERHALAQDTTCLGDEVRVLDLSRLSRPAHTTGCPVRVRLPRTVRSGQVVRGRISCPRGCRGEFDLVFDLARSDVTRGLHGEFRLRPGRTRAIRFVTAKSELGRRVPPGSRGRLRVYVRRPGARPRPVRRAVRVR